jgi:hypothetical protein
MLGKAEIGKLQLVGNQRLLRVGDARVSGSPQFPHSGIPSRTATTWLHVIIVYEREATSMVLLIVFSSGHPYQTPIRKANMPFNILITGAAGYMYVDCATIQDKRLTNFTVAAHCSMS